MDTQKMQIRMRMQRRLQMELHKGAGHDAAASVTALNVKQGTFKWQPHANYRKILTLVRLPCLLLLTLALGDCG